MWYIRKFFLSSYYLMLVFAIALYCWINKLQEPGVAILVALSSIALLCNTSVNVIFPTLFTIPFISRSHVSLNEVPSYYFIFGVILLFSVLIYLRRNEFKFKQGSLKFGFFLLAICSVISLVNLVSNGESMRYIYSLGNVLIFIIYILLSSSAKVNNTKYTFTALFLLGIFLSFQILVEGNDLGTFENKIVTLGWGGSNTAAIYINMAIIAGMYLISIETKTYKIYVLGTIVAFLAFIMIISLCRAGYVALGVCIIPAIIGSFVYSSNPLRLFFVSLSFAAMIALGFLLSSEVILNFIKKSFDKGLDPSGREELWQEGIAGFKQHMIIGNGMFSDTITRLDQSRLMPLHNTIIQCLYSFGLVGIVSLIIHYAQKFIVITRKFNGIKYFFVIITISGFIHGMLDNTYFMLTYMLIIICVMITVELSDSDLPVEEIKPSIIKEEKIKQERIKPKKEYFVKF